MYEHLRLNETIKFQKASMIIGLSGWANAGEVSTSSVRYLIDKLKAKRLGEIEPGRFYIYQLNRPQVFVKKGLIEGYQNIENQIFYWRNESDKNGLIFLLGAEPHLNWPAYAKVVLDFAEHVGSKRIYTIGGYLIDLYAERPIITGSTNNDRIIAELKQAGVELIDYRGPTSIYSEILWRGKSLGIDVVSLWCAVPLYTRGVYPKAAYQLLLKLTSLLGVKVDLEEIRQKAEAFESHLAKTENIGLRRLMSDLEARRRASKERPLYFI